MVFYDIVLVDIGFVPHMWELCRPQAIMVFSLFFFRLFGAVVSPSESNNRQNQNYGDSTGFVVYGQVYPGFFRAQVVCSFIQLSFMFVSFVYL